MRRKADAPSRIAAVEVDAPGCSYNPDAAQHEEMLARAVAEENAKLLDAEMRAKPPPKRVDWQPETDPLLQHQVCCRAPARAMLCHTIAEVHLLLQYNLQQKHACMWGW